MYVHLHQTEWSVLLPYTPPATNLMLNSQPNIRLSLPKVNSPVDPGVIFDG